MSDEEDYMSDAFLHEIQDNRPGLVPRHIARIHQQQKKGKAANVKNNQKPKGLLEKEKREEGLGLPLTSDNKGFSLLQKMGFKPGMVLGKSGTGRTEPVPVAVKTGRGGLGHETEQKRQREARSELYRYRSVKRQKVEAEHKQTFLKRMNERMVNKNMEKDLYKSQKVCEQLDSQLGIKEPCEVFFWPKDLLPKSRKANQEESLQEPDLGYSNYINEDELEESDTEDGEDDEEESHYSTEEKLEVITLYLRTKHKYCIWCGITYTDKEDMASSCPGPSAELHEDIE